MANQVQSSPCPETRYSWQVRTKTRLRHLRVNRSSSKSDPDQHENRRPKANASSNGLRAVKDHELDEPSRETRVCRDNSSPVQPTESPETPPSDLSKGTAGEQSSNSVTTTMLYGTIVQEQPHHRKISDHPATNEFPSSVGRYQIEALLGKSHP